MTTGIIVRLGTTQDTRISVGMTRFTPLHTHPENTTVTMVSFPTVNDQISMFNQSETRGQHAGRMFIVLDSRVIWELLDAL